MIWVFLFANAKKDISNEGRQKLLRTCKYEIM